MESATKALEMAFAVFVFVMALGISILNFSKVRQTSDIIIKNADSTTYYEYATYDEVSGSFKYQNGESYSYTRNGNRIVGFETVIPTVYKYNRENYTVEFKKTSDYDSISGTYTIDESLEIYKTTTNSNNWSNDYKNYFNGSPSTSSSIYRFDINEEANRHEPWVGSNSEIKKHLDAIFGGTVYHLPQYSLSNTSNDINYAGFALDITRKSNSRFIEEIGVIPDENPATNGMVGNNTISKKLIRYVLIDE